MAIRPIASFVYGFTLPLRAAKLILSQMKLLLWSIVPVVITLLLYSYVIAHVQSYVTGGIVHWVSNLGVKGVDPNGWLVWFLLLFTKILLVLMGAITFSFTSTIVSAPFNDFLAEATEEFTDPTLPVVGTQSFVTKAHHVGIDILKTIVAVVLTIAALLLSWVPVLNILALAFSLLLITFQFVSYPQTRRGVGVRAGLAHLWSHFFSSIGFGFAFSILFAIPVISAFFLPVAVVAGTLLYSQTRAGLYN